MSSLLVQKYGGTSVGTPERIQSVADRVARAKREGHDLVVVVSAMGDTTDELIELAQKVSIKPPHREMDMLLSVGERISMALLSMALSDRKIPAISLTGSQSGIITDSGHRRARIKTILGDRIREGLREDKVVIVAGFQGVSEKKEITTLGRGGSDTTAVALASVLGAQACEIFTDVDGVYSADPRIVADAKKWDKIPSDLMVEMATRGAGVLHPRSVELAKQYGVKLWVKSSFSSSSKGTEVVARKTQKFTRRSNPGKGLPLTGINEDYKITAVTADASKMLVTVKLARPTALAAVWDRAAGAHLSFITPTFFDGKVVFFAEKDSKDEWISELNTLEVEGFVASYVLDDSQVPLSVVGDRFLQDGAALQDLIEKLAQNHIFVTMGSASSLAVTVAVPRQHADDGVRALHEAYIKKGKPKGKNERK